MRLNLSSGKPEVDTTLLEISAKVGSEIVVAVYDRRFFGILMFPGAHKRRYRAFAEISHQVKAVSKASILSARMPGGANAAVESSIGDCAILVCRLF